MASWWYWRAAQRGPLVVWALCAAISAAAGSEVHAQEPTGKLQGGIHDPLGNPLSGVQVFVLGTAFGGLSDPRGRYFINNLPSSTISLRAALIGYRPVEVHEVRISAGHAVTLDITLERSRPVLQEVTVLAAENPLVPRDEVTTRQRVQGEFLRKLPVDNL